MESNIERFHDSLNDVKAKNQHLQEEKILLEKEIQKQKIFHRNYVKRVAATRAIRIQEHKIEKKALLDERNQLIAVNHKLIKDVEFYKNRSTTPKQITQKRWTTEIAQMNLSLYEQNKKLQQKLNDASSKNKLLNQKVEQLEHFRNQIENKKSNKVCRDCEELEGLVDFPKKTNKDVYTPEVLEMLGNLAENKK